MDNYFNLSLKNILDYLDEGLYFTDLNKNIHYCNSGAETITGYRFDEIAMQKCCNIISHTDLNGEQLCEKQCLITKIIEEKKMQEVFAFISHKDGHLVPVTIRTFPVYDKANHITGFIELITDNTRQKLGQAKMNALTQAAYIDSLSELFSKQYLENRLQTMLTKMADTGKAFAILYINIIGFRAINDMYGVSRGDKILKMVAKTLSTAISSSDIIGRWHGASFIAISNTTNKSLLLLLADKLKGLIAESDFTINGETMSVNITITYTIAQMYDTFDYLIERATKGSPAEKESATTSKLPPVKASPPAVTKQNVGFHSRRSDS